MTEKKLFSQEFLDEAEAEMTTLRQELNRPPREPVAIKIADGTCRACGGPSVLEDVRTFAGTTEYWQTHNRCVAKKERA